MPPEIKSEQASVETPSVEEADHIAPEWMNELGDDDDFGEEGDSGEFEGESRDDSGDTGEGDEGEGERSEPGSKTPAATETPAEQPAPQSQTQEQPVAQQPQQAPVQQPEGKEESVNWAKVRQDAEAQLQGVYALSEEEAQAFNDDPVAALPKLAAKMHVEMFDSVFRAVLQQVPTLVQQMNQQSEVQRSFTDKFFSYEGNQGLREHATTAQKMIDVYAQMNPQASEEELIVGAGRLAAAALGLDKQTPPAQAQQPVVQQQPAHRPAAAGSVAPPPRSVTNEFEALAEEFLQDDI